MTWVWIEDDGSLVIEFYDYSEDAQKCIGNDIAYILTVPPSEIGKVLLELFAERFASYFAVQEWLTLKDISFAKRVEDPA